MGLSVQTDQTRRLTIVIPVHKMAGRLGNLNFSITSTEEEVDFILVLDDTGDSTLSELQSIAEVNQEKKIMIVKGVYQSPGLARNAGLEHVTTPFVMFADSDDRFFVSQIMAAINAISDETEVLVGGFKQTDLKNDSEKIFLPRNPLFIDLTLNPGLWRIVMKTAMTKRTHFKNYRMAEDQVWMAEAKLLSKRIEKSNNIFYQYFSNQNQSLTSNQSAKKDLLLAIKDIKKLINDKDQSNKEYLYTTFTKLWITTYLNTRGQRKKFELFVLFFNQLIRSPLLLIYGFLIIFMTLSRRIFVK